MTFFHLYTEDEFEGIAREHLPLFYGMAMRILKNNADAEDAVQATLLRGWNRRFFLRSPEKLVSWLTRIVVNECYGILRKKGRSATVPLDAAMEEQLECEDESRESSLREARMQKLHEAVAALPEIYRSTVHWALLSGLGGEEAAAILGCSVNTLYQRVHKAKQLLREALKDE